MDKKYEKKYEYFKMLAGMYINAWHDVKECYEELRDEIEESAEARKAGLFELCKAIDITIPEDYVVEETDRLIEDAKEAIENVNYVYEDDEKTLQNLADTIHAVDLSINSMMDGVRLVRKYKSIEDDGINRLDIAICMLPYIGDIKEKWRDY